MAGLLANAMREGLKLRVWSRARLVEWDPLGTNYRHDRFGRVMHYEAFGDRDSVYGWELDFWIPLNRGGTDCESNQEALNCKSYSEKAEQIFGASDSGSSASSQRLQRTGLSGVSYVGNYASDVVFK